ncbi:MAG: hypothetical protein IJA12_00705 [Oscillospiraceae bacterium]|nr:hypothetical protein [Oscillospiraceae bacterium]
MKKLFAALLLLTLTTTLYGCSHSDNELSDTETSNTETSIITSSIKDTTEKPYTHSENGYFNLVDSGYDLQMDTQEGGTCWLYSASVSIESSYFLNNGTNIDINPLEMLDIIYSDDKSEGFFVKEGINKKELGGWSWMITETLSNGFGKYVIDKATVIEEGSTEKLKETIKNTGAVIVSVPDTDRTKKGAFNNYMTINHVTDNIEDYDHDVTIIGWDDNFPKEYFKDEASQNGAWIAYNSLLGDFGYYYISYDTALKSPVALSVTDKYSDILFYDCGNEGDASINVESNTKTANIFHKEGTLSAVGTYSTTENQKIKIELYDSNFENILYSQDAVLTVKGYNVIELDKSVEVCDYAIAIQYSSTAPVEGETWDDGIVSYKVQSEKGQSYVYLNDMWQDITDEAVISELGIDFIPNNCCIKALYS